MNVSDARKKFKGHPFLHADAETECPFVGNTVGYINFDITSVLTTTAHVGTDSTEIDAKLVHSARAEFVRMFMYETRGIIAR